MDVYVMKGGQRRGPFQPFRLTEMLEDGELTPEDPVWHEGMETWRPLQDTESLQSVMRRLPGRGDDGSDEAPEKAADAGKPPPLPPETTLLLLRQRRTLAWRRFFARQIDMTISSTVVVLVATFLGYGDWWALMMPSTWTLILAPALLWILPEAMMLSLLGSTPGRAMLGLRVVDANGDRPAFPAALKRSVLVWAGGFGFGLPAGLVPAGLLPVTQWLYAFWHFQRRGETLWDHSAGTRVAFCQLQRRHVAGIVAITAAMTALYSWIVFTAPLPARFSDEEREQWEKIRKRAWERTVPPRNNSGLPSGRGA